MNRGRNLALNLYRRLVRLYPPHFRQTYGEELVNVFDCLTWEAGQTGAGIIAACLHEFADLPGNIIREHLEEFRRKKNMAPVSVLPTGTNSTKRLPGIAALGFGVAFAFEGLIFSIFRMGIGVDSPAAGAIMLVFFLALPAFTAGWLGAFAVGRVVAPDKARKAALWSGLAALLAMLLTSSGIWDLVFGDLEYIPPQVDTFLLFFQPLLVGMLVAAAVTMALGKNELLLRAILITGPGFFIGFLANRLLLTGIEIAFYQMGELFPPSNIVLFALSWGVSYALVGLLGGLGLGIALAGPRLVFEDQPAQ